MPAGKMIISKKTSTSTAQLPTVSAYHGHRAYFGQAGIVEKAGSGICFAG